MWRFLLHLAVTLQTASGGGPAAWYQLSGQVTPAGPSAITVFGAISPFNASALSDSAGHFTFKKLQPGTYTVSVFNPQYGEARRTVEVGPSTAGRNRRVSVSLEFKPSDFSFASVLRRDTVSARELAIPEKALREYEEARKALSRHNVNTAVKKLERAVKAAPQFSAAWNQLGTISYQTHKFARAEQCFRRALDADPKAFAPLVNLGGTLVTLGRTKEALDYNRYAVLAQPHDALANSQLGLSYFLAGDYERALKYLEIARQIDPAHFSHPQLAMAEIHVRLGDRQAAAADLEDFLKYHPGWPAAEQIRRTISQWKK